MNVFRALTIPTHDKIVVMRVYHELTTDNWKTECTEYSVPNSRKRKQVFWFPASLNFFNF